MTTLHVIELTCPVCSQPFRSQSVIATHGHAGKRTDFHERATGMQPLPYFVHLCGHCGFAGLERDFTEGYDATDEVRDRVWTALAPALQREVPLGSLKYEHAAKVAEWQGSDPRYLADLYLRAAWCCVDELDTEAERYFRRKAAWRFAEALANYDGVPAVDRAVLTYLVGELWRRIGDQVQAAEWFARVPGEIVDADNQQWVVNAAEMQRTAPQEWFG